MKYFGGPRCPLWINWVDLTLCQPHPVCPAERRSSESIGISQTCQTDLARRAAFGAKRPFRGGGPKSANRVVLTVRRSLPTAPMDGHHQHIGKNGLMSYRAGSDAGIVFFMQRTSTDVPF